MQENEFLTITEAAKYLNVGKSTLNTWEKNGLIQPMHTVGGHRRYRREDLLSVLRGYGNVPHPAKRVTVGYCRVSSSSQKEDLERQVSVVQNYCEKNGYSFKIIEDIGSGLNDKRKGLAEVIRLVCSEQCDRIVVNYKDRLARFGTGIIEEMCEAHGVEIEVINQSEKISYEKELVDDVLSIINVSSAKLYGQRSHRNKRIVEENKALFSESGNETDPAGEGGEENG